MNLQKMFTSVEQSSCWISYLSWTTFCRLHKYYTLYNDTLL